METHGTTFLIPILAAAETCFSVGIKKTKQHKTAVGECDLGFNFSRAFVPGSAGRMPIEY
jgi:hypothetical protein